MTTEFSHPIDPIAELAGRIAAGAIPRAATSRHGGIRAVRVSSAQCAAPYPYWGACRYAIRLTKDGRVVCSALERASSDRRSVAGAERDAEALADSETRFKTQTIGMLDRAECARVLAWLDSR